MDSKLLGLKIKQLRSDYGLKIGKKFTQQDLAKELGISRSYLSDIESGRTTASDEIITKLSKIFDINSSELFQYKKNKKTMLPSFDGTDELNSNSDNIEINVPKEYTDKFKVTSRDKKQYLEEMKKANEAFFMDDEFTEESKKEMLDLMSELFWEAKTMNKRKK